eukprot:Opistho-1_new@78076
MPSVGVVAVVVFRWRLFKAGGVERTTEPITDRPNGSAEMVTLGLMPSMATHATTPRHSQFIRQKLHKHKKHTFLHRTAFRATAEALVRLGAQLLCFVAANRRLLLTPQPLQVTQVAAERLHERRLVVVAHAKLLARLNDNGANLRVVVLADAGEQVVCCLVVECAGEHVEEPRVVSVVLAGQDLHLRPVVLDALVGVGHGPLDLADDVVGLEGERKPQARDGIRDGKQQHGLPRGKEREGKDDAVRHEERLAKPDHGRVVRRDVVDADGAVATENVQDGEVLQARLDREERVEERHVHVLVPVERIPPLRRLDAANVRVRRDNVGVGAVNIRVRVVTDHVLVLPHKVRGAVEEVVECADGLPDPRAVRDGEVARVVHRHHAHQRRCKPENRRGDNRQADVRVAEYEELSVPREGDGEHDKEIPHKHPRRKLRVLLRLDKVVLHTLFDGLEERAWLGKDGELFERTSPTSYLASTLAVENGWYISNTCVTSRPAATISASWPPGCFFMNSVTL